MLRFFKDLLKGKVREPEPIKETVAPYKVETPVITEPTPAPTVEPEKPAKKAPAKKRTFVKRQEGGAAKVAKIKAPAKPKSPAKPRTPK
jgi:hypothetical protein